MAFFARISLLGMAGVLAVSGSAETLYYFKEPMPLSRWEDRYVTSANPLLPGRNTTVPGFEVVRTNQPVEAMRSSGNTFVTPAYRDAFGGVMFPTQDLFLAFEQGIPAERALAIARAEVGGTVLSTHAFNIKNLFHIRTDIRRGEEILDLAARLSQRSDVRYSHPDLVFSGRNNLTSNDPLFPDQWHIRNLTDPLIDTQADLAWDVTTGSPSILTIVIDNGVQGNHPDLALTTGATFTGESGAGTPVSNLDRHGTPVAGCIGATINNALGVSGIAPTARIGSARPHRNVSISGFEAQASWVAAALDWAVLQGARITNNSNSYNTPTALVSDKYAATYQQGLVHFASAGNGGTATLAYPASLSLVNAVVSITQTGAKATSSQYGPGTDFAAPGVGIWTTDRTGSDGYNAQDYHAFSGTSAASPNAAAVCALALSANPHLTPSRVEEVLQNTALDLGAPGYDTTFGHGLVNAQAAVNAARAIRWTGTVTFLDLAGPHPDSINLTYDLPGTLLDRTVAIPLVNGTFDIVAPKGPFTVRITRRPWLSKILVLNNPGVLFTSFTLTNGDPDGSGEVDAADIDYVIAEFGQTPIPGRPLFSDIDGSGEVDAADIDVVIANFGAVGD